MSLVVPALNESANLPAVLSRIPELIDEVILVDGHSTDDTISVARAHRPDIRVVTQTRRGKGNALACGFALCRGDIIVMIDADGSTDPGEIPRFVAELRNGADVVKGSRYVEDGGSEDLTRVRRYGNSVLTGAVNLLFGTPYTDLCYGYMAFWRSCLPYLGVDRTGFEIETLLTLRAVRSRLTVVEVPSTEKTRISGESRLHPVRDGLRIFRTIIGERLGPDHAAGVAPAWAALSGELRSLDGPAPRLVGHSPQTPASHGSPAPMPEPASREVGPDAGLDSPVPKVSDETPASADLVVIVESTQAASTLRRTRALGAHVVVMSADQPRATRAR